MVVGAKGEAGEGEGWWSTGTSSEFPEFLRGEAHKGLRSSPEEGTISSRRRAARDCRLPTGDRWRLGFE